MPISCHFRDCKTSPKKVVKVKERFSCVARWNFTKLEVKVVKLSFKDIFYFRISKKLPSFCTKTVDRQAAVGKLLFCPVKFNIGHGTEKFRRLFQSDRHTSRAAVWHWRAQRSSQKVLWRINKKLISRRDKRTLRRHSSYRMFVKLPPLYYWISCTCTCKLWL